MKKKIDEDLRHSYIVELSLAEIKLLAQVTQLYWASFPDSELAPMAIDNFAIQVNLPKTPELHDVFPGILKADARFRRGMIQFNSQFFIPYEMASDVVNSQE